MRYNPDRNRTEKPCSKCRRVLPLDAFGKAAKQWDGLNTYCKDCVRVISNEDYDRKRDSLSGRRRSLKMKYIEQLGGRCSRCGYNEFLSCLDFHHTDERESGTVADLLTKALAGHPKHSAWLEREIGKCILLCHNCHMSLHRGEWQSEHGLPERKQAGRPRMQTTEAD